MWQKHEWFEILHSFLVTLGGSMNSCTCDRSGGGGSRLPWTGPKPSLKHPWCSVLPRYSFLILTILMDDLCFLSVPALCLVALICPSTTLLCHSTHPRTFANYSWLLILFIARAFLTISSSRWLPLHFSSQLQRDKRSCSLLPSS